MRLVHLGAALTLVAAVAGTYVYRSRGAEDADGRYATTPVERGDVVATVTATGTVNPVKTVQVGTYVSGPIIAVDVDYNSRVAEGQRVALIDPAPFRVKVQRAEANLETAEARVRKARADLELKRLTLDRNRRLHGRDSIVSQNELDTATSSFDQAAAQLALEQAGVKQAAAELEEARINLAYTEIRSPVDGVVVSRSVDVGQTVAASFQTPTLFQIAQDLTKMQVNASVSEADIGAVREGQTATFRVDAYPARTFEGTVVQVRSAPVTVQNVVTYDVVVAVDNGDLALRPGMTAAAAILTARAEDVLRVPVRALTFAPGPAAEGSARSDGDASAVWRVDADGSIERVPVRTGLADDTFVEIREGALAPGDEIALALRERPDAVATPRGFFGLTRGR
jgi:HlyD family secretion protein